MPRNPSLPPLAQLRPRKDRKCHILATPTDLHEHLALVGMGRPMAMVRCHTRRSTNHRFTGFVVFYLHSLNMLLTGLPTGRIFQYRRL